VMIIVPLQHQQLSRLNTSNIPGLFLCQTNCLIIRQVMIMEARHFNGPSFFFFFSTKSCCLQTNANTVWYLFNGQHCRWWFWQFQLSLTLTAPLHLMQHCDPVLYEQCGLHFHIFHYFSLIFFSFYVDMSW